MQRDPVCGTDVEATAAVHAAYHGTTYSFCSLRCKQAFEDSPPTYTAQAAPANRSLKAAEAVGQTFAMVHASEPLDQSCDPRAAQQCGSNTEVPPNKALELTACSGRKRGSFLHLSCGHARSAIVGGSSA